MPNNLNEIFLLSVLILILWLLKKFNQLKNISNKRNLNKYTKYSFALRSKQKQQQKIDSNETQLEMFV